MNLNKAFGFIGIIILLLGQSNEIFATSITSDKFEYYKEIYSEKEGLSSIELDPEVYGFTAYSTPDMRIFDSDGVEVQYHKYSDFSLEDEEILDFSIINRSDDEGVIKITFVKEPTIDIYNKITVDIRGENFLLSPMLYGSQNGTDFSPISSKGYIYNFVDENKGSNDTISFGEVNYKYLRAEFETVMGNVSSGDIIKGSYIRNLHYIPDIPEKKQIESDIVSTTNIDKTTEIIIDVKYSHMPISNIVFHTNNENYYRDVQVQMSDNMKEFNVITNDKISSFDIEDYKVEDNEIKMGHSCLRYIKLIINNYDNAPLNISEVNIFYQPDTLVFEASPDKTYKLYYGSNNCDAPIYDISYIADRINEKTTQTVQLGQGNKNPDYKKQDIPLTERNNNIITISIVLVVVVLGYVIIKNIKDK